MPQIPKHLQQLQKQDAPVVRLVAGCAEGNREGGGFVGRALAPTVRLVPIMKQGVENDLNLKALSDSPVVRLSVTNDGMPSKESRYPEALGESPVVRLAHVPGAQGDNNLLGQRGVEALPDQSKPALLVSYYYLDGFEKNKHRYRYRDWMMDSGAYSAYNSGATINIDDYIACCHRLLQTDPTLTEIIALDVIGSGPDSLKNAIYMQEAGLDVIPVHHIGEDMGILKEYCARFWKVGLSCRFGESMKDSLRYYDQCFARTWPKKFHSFGWIDEKMLMRYPFHSSDSSSWEVGPCAFANWKFFGRVSIRGSNQNLRSQVEWYLDLEDRLRQRWRREMELLSGLATHAVRMVVGTGRSTAEIGYNAFK